MIANSYLAELDKNFISTIGFVNRLNYSLSKLIIFSVSLQA